MSRKKKIGIILILLAIIGFLAFGGTVDTNITQTFTDFKTKTKTETFKMIKFSTEDYPTIKAYFYLAIDKNQPNIKLSDGSFNPNAIHIGNVDKEGVTITEIESDTNGEGLDFYYICIEYTVTDLSNNNRSDKFYIVNSNGSNKITTEINNYSVREIEALFTNPNRDTRILSRQNEKIILSGKAYSKTKRGTYYADPSGTTGTTISSNTTKTKFISKAESESYEEIDSGKFKIDSYDNVAGVVGLPYTEDNKTYYPVTLEINSTSNANIYNSLISNPNGHTLIFTAKSKSGLEDSDILDGVNVVEGDQPKITNITTINNTLKSFMYTLLPTNDNSTFYTKTASSSTGLTDNNLSDKLLNVKSNDGVDVEFTVDDESITSSRGNLSVTYNGVTYSYVDGVKGTNPIEYKGITETKTTWRITVPGYISKLNSITFNITDKSLSPNNINNNLTLFTEPSELENTKFNSNTNPAGSVVYPNYYKNSSIDINTVGTTDAIAYMIVYDLDKSKSDLGSTEKLENQLQGVLRTTAKMTFPSDGEYKYAEVYTINKAGAIKGITSDNVNSYDSIKKAIISKGAEVTFYIDRIAPRVTSYDFYKYEDKNKNDITGISSEATALYNSLLIGSNKPYKTDDGIEIKATVKEYNMAETTDTSGIVTWNVIPTAGTYDIINGASYEKKGTAVDLTVDTGNVPKIMSSTFYDKAGNSTIPTSVDITFDDRIPSTLTAINEPGLIIPSGVVIKFTKNISIPLGKVDDISKNPTLSVAVVNDSSVANATSDVNLTSFSPNVEINKNHNNVFNITTYSSSGEKGIRTQDSIVLDTEVNGGASIVNESYTTSGSYNVFNLNSLLDSVTELVGLKSFTVTKSGTGSNAKISDNGTEKALGTVISLDDYSNYNDILMPTVYSTLSTPRNYKLLIPKGITGKMNYKINLKDRLGNSKDVIYTVIITGKTNIIGTSKNSKMKITTTISNGSEMKIQARTE